MTINTYEFSNWIHSRFAKGADRHPMLRKADDETVAILCQKLLTDDISLTKMVDLFHHLTKITLSQNGLRELLLNVLACHHSNTPVVQRFIKIAGSMYSGDQIVGQALLTLTKAQNEQVRETAFITLSQTAVFRANFEKLRSAFMSDHNRTIRQRILRAAAISLGRNNLAAINLSATLSEVPLEQILDFEELLDEGLAGKIAAKARDRVQSNEQRILGGNFQRPRQEKPVSPQEVKAVIRRQEEVLCKSPVIKMFFETDKPERYRDTLKRFDAMIRTADRKLRGKLDAGW